MAMRDVTDTATELMRSTFGGDQYYRREWELLGQRHVIPLPEWVVLDETQPDGFSVPLVRYEDRGIKGMDKIGRVFVLERDTGKTTLFFVWVPPDLLRLIQAGASGTTINYHVLFHPSTHTDMYRVPYWNGVYEEKDEKGKIIARSPSFVLLGTRYLFYDFRSLAQHLMARPAPLESLVLVVPVSAASRGYFSDLQSPDTLLAACREIGDFIRDAAGTDAAIGSIMLTGYSYSGHVLEGFLNNSIHKPEHRRFYESRLSQLTLMDIHLSNNAQERMAKFRALWNHVYELKEKFNRDLVIRVYTAYRDHADYVRNYKGDGGGPLIARDISVNLDSVAWSDKDLKKKLPRRPRGEALQFFNGDLSLALLHFPASFFRWYVDRTENDVGFDLGEGQHGHGWLLRVFLSHALYRRTPVVYKWRASEVVAPRRM